MPEYEIRVRGHLDPSWSTWFADLNIEPTTDGETILRGRIVDQTALHGVLSRIRDLALELLSLRQVND